MDDNNIIVYLLENNVIILIKEIEFPNRFEWYSLDEFKTCFKIDCEKMKYFDDEGELISIMNENEFSTFKELTLNEEFPGGKVVVIAYTGSFDVKEYGRLEKLLEMKVKRKKSSNSFLHIKSVSSTNNSGSSHEANCDSSSSSSSGSLDMEKLKVPGERKKSPKTMIRYAARLKKDLNYLPGSEVSDNQTILKKWRIKNVGSKKWKENSVKGVLLPSEYSSWVTCAPFHVSACFADQSVDVELEISIHGQWENEELRSNDSSRDISLTWLLFKDSLVTKHGDNFKDYILTQLELAITVKRRMLDTDFQTEKSDNKLERCESDSSIEKIDQEFAIVEVSEDVKNSDHQSADNSHARVNTSNNLPRTESIAIDLELPDCPVADDFQISDFFTPNSFIPIDSSRRHTEADNQSTVSHVGHSDAVYVDRLRSNHDDALSQKNNESSFIDTSINESSLPFASKPVPKPRLSTNPEHTNFTTNTEDIGTSILTEMSFVLANGEDSSIRHLTHEKGTSISGERVPSVPVVLQDVSCPSDDYKVDRSILVVIDNKEEVITKQGEDRSVLGDIKCCPSLMYDKVSELMDNIPVSTDATVQYLQRGENEINVLMNKTENETGDMFVSTNKGDIHLSNNDSVLLVSKQDNSVYINVNDSRNSVDSSAAVSGECPQDTSFRVASLESNKEEMFVSVEENGTNNHHQISGQPRENIIVQCDNNGAKRSTECPDEVSVDDGRLRGASEPRCHDITREPSAPVLPVPSVTYYNPPPYPGNRPTMATQYHAGSPYSNTGAIGSGWNYTPGMPYAQYPPQNTNFYLGYQPHHNTTYQAGMPVAQPIRSVYPPLTGLNSTTHPAHAPPYNPNVMQQSHPPAPNVNIYGRNNNNNIGFRR